MFWLVDVQRYGDVEWERMDVWGGFEIRGFDERCVGSNRGDLILNCGIDGDYMNNIRALRG